VELHTNLNANAQPGDTFSSPITVYDTLGGSHVLTFTYTNTGTSAWSYQITVPAADVGQTGAAVSVATGSLTFDTSGQLTSPSADVTGIQIKNFADGAADLSFDWKLFDGGSTLTQLAAQSNTSATSQDGNSSGSLLNFSIGSDGLITGAFSNGRTSVLGQLAVASFANPQGLSRIGNNDFTSTLSSGQAAIGTPGTSGRGTLAGGALELSNVDIAKEFSKLIVAQRSFEANARTVTTFDQITQDTIDLKR
jgi:flagellar hook protein FlgE